MIQPTTIMPCVCNNTVTPLSPSGEALPLIATDYAINYPEDAPASCCDTNTEDSYPGEGALVPAAYMETCCRTEGVTLLGRHGDRWARLKGSGFIQLVKGRAKVVQQVAIQLLTLWHQQHKVSGKGIPVAGLPLDSPYDVIADATGGIHAQRGLDGEDSTRLWDATTRQFRTVAVSEFPKTQKGLLPQAAALELVGVAAIAADGSVTAVRPLSTLMGEGIIVVTQQPTVAADTCQCSPEIASVATILPHPTGDGVFTLKFTEESGPYWSAD